MTKLFRVPKRKVVVKTKRPGVRECRRLLRKLGAPDSIHVMYDRSVAGYDVLTGLASVNAIPTKRLALAAVHAALTVLAGSK